MNKYQSVSSITGKSTGVLGYNYDNSSITLHFKTGSVYVYTIESCGLTHLNNMKKLADSQSGLNTYVTTNKLAYSSKS